MRTRPAIFALLLLVCLAGCLEEPANRVRLKLEAPNPSYHMEITEAWLKDGDLFVLAVITQRSKGMDSAIVLPVVDTVDVQAEFDEVHAYVMGKTWSWGRTTYTFIEDRATFDDAVAGGKPVEFTQTYRERPNRRTGS